MADGRDDAPGIESIKPAPSAPSNDVENLTSHEAAAYGQGKKKVTPSDRHQAEVDRHLFTWDKHCSKLEERLAQQQAEINAIRDELTKITPEHARLAESYRNLVYNNTITSTAAAIGAVIVSLAGATPYFVPITCVGASVFVVGLALQCLNTFRSGWFAGPGPRAAVARPPNRIGNR